jgi:hypothetical protein
MKNKVKLLYGLLAIITLFSCNKSPKEIEADYVNSEIVNLKPGPEKKWVVVLPGLGCKGCIQEGEFFMQQHISNNKILFLLTKVESVKLLEQKTGIKIKNHQNVLIDRNNSFDLPSDNSIYPLIVEVSGKKVLKYQFQSPQNANAFAMLNDQL